MKIINLSVTILALFYLTHIPLNSMVPDDITQMKDTVNEYYRDLSRTPEETLHKSMRLSENKKSELQTYLKRNQDWIQPLATKSSSLENSIRDTKAGYILLKENNPASSNIHRAPGNYYIVENDFIMIISSQFLRMKNITEKTGLYTKFISNNLTPEDVTLLNKEVSTQPTYQHISRAHYLELLLKTKKDKNLTDVFAPITYLVKFPWATEEKVTDETYAIFEEKLNDIRPVDPNFIQSMTHEQVRQIYEAVKCVGIWNLNWYIDNTGKMYILDMEQPDKNSPEYYASHKDLLLGRREGVKALAGYFTQDSQQIAYLLDIIENDPELSFIDENEQKIPKNFKKTLTKKVHEAVTKPS